ncbi:MAG TPA: penicillin-binding protein 2 [bacterium]|nr:penicillin-binding protein 2 [bacterium]HPL95764.1 penicillin-binding protein 2 [bacterium]
MTNPFATPEDLLETRRNYQIPKEKESGDGFFIDEHYKTAIGRVVSEGKIRSTFFICFIFIILLLARVFYLQIIKGETYLAIAEENRIRLEIVPSPRGLFFDKNGQQLVTNQPKFSLVLERSDWEREKFLSFDKLVGLITELGDFITEEVKTVLNDFITNKEIPAVAFELDYEQALKFKIKEEDYKPWRLQISSYRQHLEPEALSGVIGYLGRLTKEEWLVYKDKNYRFIDLVGKSGLEKEYEEILRGEPGYIEYEVNAFGQRVKTMSQKDPIPGADLKLTLDVELTKKLYEELQKETKILNRPKAAAVAIDPNTGGILALVSLPTFNNNFFSNPKSYQKEISNYLIDKNQPLYNRAISGQYPSGSTIKILWALAALEENIINTKTTVLSTGGIRIGQWFYPDWKVGGHGVTNVIKALAESVNTFFYYIVGGYQDFTGLGLDKILIYGQKFGLNQILGIDLPSEAAGFLPTKEWKEETKKERWYIGDTYHVAIGQGDVLVTPLQIANITAAIANGGTIFRPHLVEKAEGEWSNNWVSKPLVLAENLADRNNIDIIKLGLRQTVISGSAQILNNLPVAVAAKTGTAQVGGQESPHAWVTVFAPYENPEIVLTILIENGGEGSSVAVPVVRNVLEWYFSNKR